MDVITIESEAFNILNNGLTTILDYIKKLEEENKHLSTESMVIDNYDLCTYLRVSSKTLWRKRDDGLIEYIDDGGRIRYRISAIRKFLDKHTIKGCTATIDDIIASHLNYVEQRKDSKYNQ